jgi:hypothetical protein
MESAEQRIKQMFSDEFMKTTCSLDGDECVWNDCKTCSRAIKYQQQRAYNELYYKVKRYTDFAKEGNLSGMPMKVNSFNTIAKMARVSPEIIANVLSENTEGNYQKLELSEEVPKMYEKFPEWWFLRRYNDLPSPEYYLYMNDYPLLAVYPDLVYLVAPKLEYGTT